jgi:metal-responsive CopG/Arc/MetJ family transcriptional regulator
MQLADSFRESLVDELDDMLENYGDSPDTEAIAEFLIEQLELYADERGIEDILAVLEEAGELDSSLKETLESEMSSNDEFEYTGEEIVSLLERLCSIEWGAPDDDDDLDDDDEEDDDEEEAEEEL